MQVVGGIFVAFGILSFLLIQLNAALDYSGEAFDGFMLVSFLIIVIGLILVVAPHFN